MVMNLRPTQYTSFRYTCIENRTKRQSLIYKDRCKIDWLIANNGWDTKYNLVSIWSCEEPIIKKAWFEKEFTPYPHFIVYDFEVMMALLNENPTDDLKYLSSHTPTTVVMHDTLGKESVYIIDEISESLNALNKTRINSCRCF